MPEFRRFDKINQLCLYIENIEGKTVFDIKDKAWGNKKHFPLVRSAVGVDNVEEKIK